MALDIYDIVRAVRATSFTYADERDLQELLAGTLAAAGAESVQREVQIEGGRIDLIVDGVGIEVKIKGTTAEVRRQLTRYANGGDLTALLLVTSRSPHLRLASRDAYAVPVAVAHVTTV